jgi:hypothetical protein
MTAGLALVVLLLIDRAGLKAESEAKDSILAALRASHDEVQDLAMRAMRGDFERRTDR